MDNISNVIPTSETVTVNSTPQTTIIQGDIKMADIVTGNVTGMVNSLPEFTFKEVADHRRETAHGFCETNRTVMSEGQENVSATKDARHDINSRISQATADLSRQVDAIDDTLSASVNQISRDTMDLRAQVLQLGITVKDNAQLTALQTEKAVLANTIELAKQTTYLSDKIANENEKTRDLINDLKYHDLNRGLVERNTELVECAADRRHWRHTAEQNQFAGQWAALQSQIQAFASQLQETRQGITNFGTMAGVGQSSTSNNA